MFKDTATAGPMQMAIVPVEICEVTASVCLDRLLMGESIDPNR